MTHRASIRAARRHFGLDTWGHVAILAVVALACDGSPPASFADEPQPREAVSTRSATLARSAIRERVCADGRDEALDVVCLTGERVDAIPFGCRDAVPLIVCHTEGPPGYVELSCLYEPGGTPTVTHGALVEWRTGDPLAVPSSATAPEAIAVGAAREERFGDTLAARAAFDAIGARLRDLGCRWRVVLDEEEALASCADVELWVTRAVIGQARVRILAGNAALFDCWWEDGVHDGTPRPRP